MAQEISTEVAGQSANLLTIIGEAARDPSVDAGKMQSLATLAIELQTHEQNQQFNRDFVAACSEMPVITKAGRIVIPANPEKRTPERTQGSFAKFEDLNRIVKPILNSHNLSITFELGDEGGKPSCTPILWHRNGYRYEGKTLSAPIDSSGSKNNTQGVGSTSQYLKRYTMCAALNIVTESEDDDGSGGKVLMPEERGNLIIEEAQAAFDEGRYAEWFKQQSPKDRGWLVTSGRHTQYGGTVAIADQRKGGDSHSPPKNPPPASDKPSEEEAAADWTKRYVAQIAESASLDAFAAIQEKFKDRLERIKSAYPALWNEINFAHGSAYDRLSGNQDDSKGAGDTLFGDDI